MTPEQFDEVGQYIASLWPGCTLTAAQIDIWHSRLRYFTVDECKRGLANLFADGNGRRFQGRGPELEDARKKILAVHGTTAKQTPYPDGGYTNEPENFSDELEGMRRDIAEFLTPELVVQWRQLILKAEPWTQCFAKRPITDQNWVSLIHSRAIREEFQLPIGEGARRQWQTVRTETVYGKKDDPLNGII